MGLFDLSGRVAVVVGGTSGIGREMALGFADAGADVVSVGRRAPLVDAVADAIEARGRRTLRLPTDTTDTASLERARDAVLEAFGHVDILLCAAGMTKRVPTLEMTDDDWQRIMATNVTGTLRSCQMFGRGMVERRSGRIITIASLASFVGLLEVAAYVASKSAVAGLTRALAVEWAPSQRDGERHRSWCVQDGSERRAARFPARAGVSAADADETIRQHPGAGRCGGLSSHRTRRRSSPATCWRWTADFSPAG